MQEDFERLYAPEYVVECLKYLLCITNPDALKSIESLAIIVIEVINDFKKITLSNEGLYISSRLYLPYDYINFDVLCSLLQYLKNTHHLKGITKTSVDESSVYFTTTEDLHRNEKMGASPVLCALLLLLKQQYAGLDTHAFSIFDSVLQTVIVNTRINKIELMQECMKYGYTTPMSGV